MRLLSLSVVLGTFVLASCAKDPVTDGGSGGQSTSGGVTGSGGKAGSGGVTGSGGKTSTGGTTSSGGSTTTTTIPATVDCTDTSTMSSLVGTQYGAQQITVDNNANKSYFMQANWWGTPYNSQTENINGIGFTMNNPNNASSSNSTPIGYPSMYIGSYQCRATKGSNLPKQVSSLTSVPTIFSTNADSKGWSNYSADYDVWLTQSSSTLGCNAGDPGAGGSFLMVWLFKPTDRQPRGTIIASGRDVSGVSGTWTVWLDSTNSPRPCVSYVSDTKLASLEFDLNNFIQDAAAPKNNYAGISSSQYLNIVFAGFEVWGGADGLQAKNFCANVK